VARLPCQRPGRCAFFQPGARGAFAWMGIPTQARWHERAHGSRGSIALGNLSLDSGTLHGLAGGNGLLGLISAITMRAPAHAGATAGHQNGLVLEVGHRAFFPLMLAFRNHGNSCGTPLRRLPFPVSPLGGFGNAIPAGKGQPRVPIAVGPRLTAAI